MSKYRVSTVAALLLCAAFGAAAQQAPSPPGSAVTVPISVSAIEPAEYNGDLRALPPLYAPNPYHLNNEFEEPPDRKPPPPPATDQASEQGPNLALAAMPAPTTSFDGLYFNQTVGGSNVGAGWPPDTNGEVGPTYYIQSVNDAYGIFSKSTGALVAGFTENQLWAGAGTGTPCDANGFGDPVVLYDAQADRWILTNFAFKVSGGKPVSPFYQCFAVSKSGDPVAGGWYLYAVRMDPGGTGAPPIGTLNDYGKFGIWTDCVYMAANGFNASTSAYAGAEFAAFDRTTLYAGGALTSSNSSIGFISSGSVPFTLIPANILGTDAGSLPPAGTAEYFVSESQVAWAFEVRKFQQGATACGSGSSLSAATNVTQTSYSLNSTTTSFIGQKNTTNTIDSLEDRLMQKVQYRRIGAAESLWVVHTTGSTIAQPQWAQITVSGGTIATTPVQQQIYAPDSSLSRWMAGVAVDHNGNMAIGYSTSSTSAFPSLAYSGRLAGDPLNQLPQTETVLVAGGGSQTNTCGSGACKRWGDYSSMSIDPTDDCTFWYTSEYYDTQTNGTSGNWHTRIGSFAFPDCSTKLSQTIGFTSTAPVGAKFGDAPYTVTATATSGLPVALTIDAASTAVCALSGSSSGSQVSYLGAGTCTIDANQAGDATYKAAAQVQQSFTVGKATQTINFTSTAPVGAKYGDSPYTVTATATSGLAVTLSIAPASASICSLSGSTSGSQVSYIGTGTCTIDANQAGNSNYNAATQVQQSFGVAKGSQSISFTSTAPVGAKYGDSPYTVTATATSGLAVTLTVDAGSTSVCSLSGSTSGSQVSYIGTGTCTINANQAGNSNYNAATQAQQSYAVGKAAQSISFTSTAPSSAQLGDPAYTVTATATSGLAVVLAIDSGSTSVCSLSGSSSGSQVSYLAAGTCTINANQAGNSNYNAATQVQQSFTVSKHSQTINFTSTAPSAAKYGDTAYTVTATATSGLAVTLTVDASSTSVCSLSGSASGSQVSYIGTGTCKIDANQAGDSTWAAAAQAQQSFSVGKGTQTITFTSTAPVGAKYGDTAYTVTASATSGLAVTLSIDAGSTSVCSLSGSSSGSQVSYIGTGTCTINANQAGNGNYNAATQVQQSYAVGKAAQSVNFTSTAPVGAKYGDTAYTVTASATSGLAVTLTIDALSASVCSLSGSTSGSQVSYIGTGTCTIDANQGGNSNYNAASQVQQSFGVGKASQSISFTSSAPANAKYGDPAYTVTATATSGLAVTLAIDAGSTSVCSLSGSSSGSQVSFIGTGTCAINANQAGNGNYNAATQAQQSFAVGKATQSINFTSTAPAGAKYGDTAYTVTASATSALAVTLTVDAGSTSVCSLSGSSSGSQVSYVGSGTCTIDANQAGNGNYNAATQAQQTFAVGKATQSVNFTSTAPVGAKYGDTAYTVTAAATSGLAVSLTVDAGSASVCSLSGSASGSQVSYTGTGTCTINADQAGNSSYDAATQVQQSFAVGKASQSVNFTSTAPSSAALGDSPYTVTASTSSGLAPLLSVDASAASVCSLDGSASGAHVSFTAAGTCIIDANQAGNGLYLAAPQAQQSFTVGPGTPALLFTTQPLDVVAGRTLGSIAVTEKNPLDQTIDDNTSVVDFTASACGSPVDLGSAPMVHGVATLATTQRFYSVTASLTVSASTPPLEATSNSFAVTPNPDAVFAEGFESCRL